MAQNRTHNSPAPQPTEPAAYTPPQEPPPYNPPAPYAPAPQAATDDGVRQGTRLGSSEQVVVNFYTNDLNSQQAVIMSKLEALQTNHSDVIGRAVASIKEAVVQTQTNRNTVAEATEASLRRIDERVAPLQHVRDDVANLKTQLQAVGECVQTLTASVHTLTNLVAKLHTVAAPAPSASQSAVSVFTADLDQVAPQHLADVLALLNDTPLNDQQRANVRTEITRALARNEPGFATRLQGYLVKQDLS